jgi:hypothetical protein
MSSWPIIAASGITGATAVIGYLFGDRSSQRSTDANIRQIESENDRVVQQITAENDRLREQRREDHLRNRQSTYHKFMTADTLMNAMFSHGAQRERVTREQYDNMSQEFLHLFNGVRLFGTQPVIDAAFELNSVHYQVFERFIADQSSRPFAEKMAEAYFSHGDALVDARVLCFDAMRLDVAADL